MTPTEVGETLVDGLQGVVLFWILKENPIPKANHYNAMIEAIEQLNNAYRTSNRVGMTARKMAILATFCLSLFYGDVCMYMQNSVAQECNGYHNFLHQELVLPLNLRVLGGERSARCEPDACASRGASGGVQRAFVENCAIHQGWEHGTGGGVVVVVVLVVVVVVVVVVIIVVVVVVVVRGDSG